MHGMCTLYIVRLIYPALTNIGEHFIHQKRYIHSEYMGSTLGEKEPFRFALSFETSHKEPYYLFDLEILLVSHRIAMFISRFSSPLSYRTIQ